MKFPRGSSKPIQDMMKSVIVTNCNHLEYWGMSIMRDSMTYCRKCMYEIWQKEQGYNGWKPQEGKTLYTQYTKTVKNYTEESEFITL